MFVCLGNICRSPMAEIIFRDMAERACRSNEFIIASSATSDENVIGGSGAPVYPPARKILAQHGLSSEGKRAVQLKSADLKKYDMFICMDRSNMRGVVRILGPGCAGKVSLLMDYTGRPGDVSDPWYTGDFETAYRDIYEGCSGLLEYLTK